MMVFIDGENLTSRFEAMAREGREPRQNDVSHRPDVFAWAGNAVAPALHHVLRATYYTYAQGSDEVLAEVRGQIRGLRFRQYDMGGVSVSGQLLQGLTPCVFRKWRDRQAKGVDIQMTVDILSHSYQGNLDTVYLVSGDGDYRPVLEEVIRRGKQVFIAALSSGLNDDLVNLADRFVSLDGVFFRS